MTIIRIEEWKNRKLVNVLREILHLAESGEVTGLVFACKLGDDQHHGVGMAGDYEDEPSPVVGIASRLMHIANSRMDRAKRARRTPD